MRLVELAGSVNQPLLIRPRKNGPLAQRAADTDSEISSALHAFIAANATRRLDMQLALPLRGIAWRATQVSENNRVNGPALTRLLKVDALAARGIAKRYRADAL
ncbi:hypothetical protein CT676_43290 [Bradyrhizobium sp. MOS001]|uniref:hypothetical protein n=1 Tax=Bradyrhizobium sp. MOS001 TaxID=2133948 RepID=UPI0010756CCC|nr:hypothetical protein [Bradyrhizobium sp. MOS001]TFW51580.1 hypothetical protein CT676_43290 [Bradyrhizobium sp. MOS001]